MDVQDELEIESSLEWGDEQQKAEFKGAKVKDLFPLNYSHERDLFFQKNCQYEPQFCYKTFVAPEPLPLSTEHQELAMKILINNKFDPPSLPTLSQKQVLKTIDAYLENLGLQDYVQVQLEPNCLSRTSVAFFKNKIVLKVRVPLSYNKVSLEGVLHHEIGTHVIRNLNHKENCLRRPTQKGRLLQEGLAALNQLLPQDRPYLFKAALRYTSAIHASKMGFSDLYKQLSKWVHDKEDCWRECVRVKRGLTNTAVLGGFYKDQSYLVGAVEILRQRKLIDFQKIYYGKFDSSESLHFHSGVLPPFIENEDKLKIYLKRLETIALCNFID